MDLRAYYKRVREMECTIATPFVVIVSVETHDGGKAGVLTEVTRHIAAKHLAEGKARVATDAEASAFSEAQATERESAEALAAAQRMQVTIVASPEPRIVKQSRSKE